MFVRNALVGTPLRGNKSHDNHGQEFTPIGNRSRYHSDVLTENNTINKFNSTSKSNNNNNNNNNMRRLFEPITEFPTNGDGRMSPSFDMTMDNFEAVTSFDQSPRRYEPEAAKSTTVRHIDPAAVLPQNFINNNGVSSIKESEERVKELQTENIKMRMRILELQKMLNGTPEDQQQLLNNNNQLRNDVSDLMARIAVLEQENAELRSSSNKENSNYDYNKDQQLAEYKLLIQRKGDELLQSRRHIEQLEKRLDSNYDAEQHQRELVSELEAVKSDYRSAMDTISEQKLMMNELYKDASHREEDNKELQRQLDVLKEQLNANHAQGEDKLNDYLNELEQAKATINHLQHDLEHVEREQSQWKRKHDDIENELKRYETVEHASKKEAAATLHDLQSLQARLRDYERESEHKEQQLSETRSKLDEARQKLRGVEDQSHASSSEVRSLKRELADLQKELQQKNEQEFNLKHEVKKYESQIGALTKRAKELEQKSTQPLSNTRLIELEERAKFYEQEYDLLREKEQSTSSRANELEVKLSACDEQILNLQQENSALENRLELDLAYKRSNSGREHDSLEAEIRRLNKENQFSKDRIEVLQLEISKLENLLDQEKLTQKSVSNQKILEARIGRLASEKTELEELADNYYNKVHELNDQVLRLRDELQSQSLNANSWEDRARTLQNDLNERERMHSYYQSRPQENSGKDDLTAFLKSKASNDDIKIRKLESEIEALRRGHDSESNQLKNKIRSLENQLTLEKDSRKKMDTDGRPSAVQALLELQLQEATRLSDELSKSLSDSTTSKEDALRKLERLEKINEELVDQITSLEADEKAAQLKSRSLDGKVRDLTQELLKVTSHCKKLANKVEELVQDKAVQAKLGQLNIKSDNEVARLKSSNAHLQRRLESLSKKFDVGNESDKVIVLENELTYYKARLYDINLKANDLQLMYTFSINSIRNSDRLIKDDIYKLVQCGIYPDYSSMKLEKLKKGKTITFKTVATFVLAAVRMKRRFERSEKRKIKLSELKSEIEIGKIKASPY
ncbi:hypothetical protein G9P44_005350 [Scheffersomyces stipitis]|nr:hypothetical protein G9P44_005350 [Scheffersomyces stipitis]